MKPRDHFKRYQSNVYYKTLETFLLFMNKTRMPMVTFTIDVEKLFPLDKNKK